MARCVRITRFDRLNHHLEKLPASSLEPTIHRVGFSNKCDWNNYCKNTNRAKAPMLLTPQEQPGHHHRECTRCQIVADHPASVGGPYFEERSSGYCCDGGVDQD